MYNPEAYEMDHNPLLDVRAERGPSVPPTLSTAFAELPCVVCGAATKTRAYYFRERVIEAVCIGCAP